MQVLLQTAIEEQLWERVQQGDGRSTCAGWQASVMLSSMCARRLTWSWFGSSKIGRGPAFSASIAAALAVAAQPAEPVTAVTTHLKPYHSLNMKRAHQHAGLSKSVLSLLWTTANWATRVRPGFFQRGDKPPQLITLSPKPLSTTRRC